MHHLQHIYLSRQGRITRSQYLKWSLLAGLVFFGIDTILWQVGEMSFTDNLVLRIIIQLVVAYISFCLGAKRLQDIGYDGMRYIPVSCIVFVINVFPQLIQNGTITTLISLGGLALFIFLLAKKGTPGPNQYGKPPFPTTPPSSDPKPSSQ